MAAYLTWYDDNSMVLQVVLTSGGSAATGGTLTGTLKDSAGSTVWTATIAETATQGTYESIIDPASADVTVGARYTLDLSGTVGGRSFASQEVVVVERRRVGDAD